MPQVDHRVDAAAEKFAVSIPESLRNQTRLEWNSREFTIGAHPGKLASMRVPGVLQGRLLIRALYGAPVTDDQVWASAAGGWTSIPRALGLICEVAIREAHNKMFNASSAAGTTYMTIWMHSQASGVTRIESEGDAAFESGYGDERYVRKKLALDGFLDWQRPVAQHWLDERESNRAMRERRWKTAWTVIGVAVAVVGVAARHYGGA